MFVFVHIPPVVWVSLTYLRKKSTAYFFWPTLYQLSCVRRPCAMQLPQMPSVYSAELVNLIRAMLNKSADKRPSVNRVLRDPYIKRNIALFLEETRSRYLVIIQLLHPFNSLFSRTTWVSRCQRGKTSLGLNEARGDGVLGCCGISWTICKQSAPRCRQITTPTVQHLITQVLQAGCSSWRPTNCVNARKAELSSFCLRILPLQLWCFWEGHFVTAAICWGFHEHLSMTPYPGNKYRLSLIDPHDKIVL